MRCPSCKATITSQDAVPNAQFEAYKCPRCGAHSTPNFDWKLLAVLALLGAPVLDGFLYFVLQNLGAEVLGPTLGSKDAITAISLLITSVVLIAVYSYLRRPKIVARESS